LITERPIRFVYRRTVVECVKRIRQTRISNANGRFAGP